jgi:hypothetical protein
MRTKAAGKALRSVSVPEVEFAYPQLLEPSKEKPSRDGGPARAYPKLSGKQGGFAVPAVSQRAIAADRSDLLLAKELTSVPPTDA